MLEINLDVQHSLIAFYPNANEGKRATDSGGQYATCIPPKRFVR